MLSRRYTISSPSPNPPGRDKSRVRRAKSTSHPAATRSELLAPQQRSRQAVAAAQRAYDDAIQRRNPKREHTIFRSSSVRFLPPIDDRNKTSDPGGFHSVNRQEPERSDLGSYVSYIAAGAAGSTCAGQENTASTRLRTLKQPGDGNGAFQLPTSSGSHTRRAMNLSDLGADYYSSPGSPVPSTPSSYRRLRKAKSVFSVSQMHPQRAQDKPSAALPPELSSREAMMMNRRKSTSFLRGGTEFMPDSMRRQLEEAGEDRPSQQQQQQPYVKERKPFYLSASCRRSQKPVAFPETVRAKKVPKEQSTDFISVRKAMSETARKVFGSMKRVFGVRGKLEDAFPEQHVPASRYHFSDFVPPSDLHSDIRDIPEPGSIRIRSNIVSRAPTFRTVPSFEMLHSIAGSIRDVTPNPPQSPVSTIRGVSVPTDGTSTWNSTLDRQSAPKKRLSIIDENAPHRIRESLYEPSVVVEPTQPRYEARRVYSALMKRLDEGPTNAPQEGQKYTCGPGHGSPGSGCYMAPGLGLSPEEETMFTEPDRSKPGISATAATTIRKSAAQKWGHPAGPSRDKNSDPFYIPPVPQIPVLYSPTVHKAQNIDSITAGWQEKMEGADEEQVRLIAALQALSPVPSTPRDNDVKDTQNGHGSAATLSITPPSSHAPAPVRRLCKTSSTALLSSPAGGSFGDAPSRYRRPKSMGMLRAESTCIMPPPPLRPPPSPPTISATAGQPSRDRDGNVVVAGGKFKIRGKLRMRDYYPNKTGAENSSKLRAHSGNQGLGLERSRSALAERTSRDIENAVNSQFGPVVNRRASKTLVKVESPESSAFI
ncbi:unnamed protein product [Tuber aestivum]|uniref:Uncharacterized protein n=1 Tax=Tuber aestivum TaxID=59557 RepID=A0A292Q7N6_9PEZI|nr:unnamed protein product [Tuber aestivum]